tara:strand:- start:849 stop:2795 length:1947 start_codon:yes stop_codon:yes gene_type:complete
MSCKALKYDIDGDILGINVEITERDIKKTNILFLPLDNLDKEKSEYFLDILQTKLLVDNNIYTYNKKLINIDQKITYDQMLNIDNLYDFELNEYMTKNDIRNIIFITNEVIDFNKFNIDRCTTIMNININNNESFYSSINFDKYNILHNSFNIEEYNLYNKTKCAMELVKTFDNNKIYSIIKLINIDKKWEYIIGIKKELINNIFNCNLCCASFFIPQNCEFSNFEIEYNNNIEDIDLNDQDKIFTKYILLKNYLLENLKKYLTYINTQSLTLTIVNNVLYEIKQIKEEFESCFLKEIYKSRLLNFIKLYIQNCYTILDIMNDLIDNITAINPENILNNIIKLQNLPILKANKMVYDTEIISTLENSPYKNIECELSGLNIIQTYKHHDILGLGYHIHNNDIKDKLINHFSATVFNTTKQYNKEFAKNYNTFIPLYFYEESLEKIKEYFIEEDYYRFILLLPNKNNSNYELLNILYKLLEHLNLNNTDKEFEKILDTYNDDGVITKENIQSFSKINKLFINYIINNNTITEKIYNVMFNYLYKDFSENFHNLDQMILKTVSIINNEIVTEEQYENVLFSILKNSILKTKKIVNSKIISKNKYNFQIKNNYKILSLYIYYKDKLYETEQKNPYDDYKEIIHSKIFNLTN